MLTKTLLQNDDDDDDDGTARVSVFVSSFVTNARRRQTSLHVRVVHDDKLDTVDFMRCLSLPTAALCDVQHLCRADGNALLAVINKHTSTCATTARDAPTRASFVTEFRYDDITLPVFFCVRTRGKNNRFETRI